MSRPRRDPDAAFDSIVRGLRPLLEARGFRQVAAENPWRRSVTFAAGEEAVRVGWDAAYGALAVEAREPEYGGSWADLALRRMDPATAGGEELDGVLAAVREALGEYLADLDAVR